MHDLDRHAHFERWRDPESGMESFILKERVAPVQQSFYFTNSSVSPDENWLWFYAAFPPNRNRVLGVVSLNPDAPLARIYPQAGFTGGASPMVAPDGRGVYFCMANSVYLMDIKGNTRLICSVPEDYIANRHCPRIATHLTLSADGKYLLLDGELGNFWWVGTGNIETGEVKILREFGENHNHAQFSPVDKSLFMLPQDWWRDRVSGKYFCIQHRIWLMNIEQTRYEPVRPEDWWGVKGGARASHEWWSRDGQVCWNDYGSEDASKGGTYEYDPYTRAATHVWKRPLCHAHCSSDRRFWCADDNPYLWQEDPVRIRFFDRVSGKEALVVSSMPQPPVHRDVYHLDPHPQFSPGNTWVVYTTTVRNRVDVALAPVKNIINSLG